MALVISIIGYPSGSPSCPLVAFTLLLMPLYLLPSKLQIGADGMTLRWFRTRFIAWSDVTRIEKRDRRGFCGLIHSNVR